MSNFKDAHTPLPSSWNPRENNGKVNPKLRQKFQQVIGSLLYLMFGTHPDIDFAVIKMSQYSVNPSLDHLNKALHIVRYFMYTQNYEIVFDGNSDEGFMAYCDSDSSDPDD